MINCVYQSVLVSAIKTDLMSIHAFHVDIFTVMVFITVIMALSGCILKSGTFKNHQIWQQNHNTQVQLLSKVIYLIWHENIKKKP